ncbi:B3/4 domain-containing protein [Parabacteroides sp. APC149_11_2_Y6]
MEIHVSISDEVQEVCPDLHVLVIACDVKNTVSDEQLWKEITDEEITVRASMKLEEINKWQPVFATRQAYKRLGKDPNRYRPSAEALRRRILRGLPLYKVDTLVDLINLLSIRSGYSIGGFDASKIVGNELILGVGREGENYQGIGRGDLNIAGLPVYRDVLGGIGTPTSDEERTKISLDTSRLLMIINGYSGEDGLEAAGRYGVDLLRRYVSAINIQAELISGGKRTVLLL